MLRVPVLLVLIVIVGMAACRQSDSATDQLTEVAKVRAGDMDVVLLSEEAAIKQGKDAVTIEFRRASDGGLVDVGDVKASATMPMAGMAPMFGSVEVQPGNAPGRYTATSDLSMAGEWRLSLEWDGPAGRGSANFSPMVQ